MDIKLRPIDQSNFIECFHLELRADQVDFVSHPIRSLAQAYVYHDQCTPFGIYHGDVMVGYLMVIYDDDRFEYNIWHMMIDQKHQGKGYGKAALQKCLDYIATKPFGDAARAVLTCQEQNIRAIRLYESLGFRSTGNRDEDEIEMALAV